MQKLSDKQANILNFMEEFYKAKRYWPDVYEVIDGLKAKEATLQAMQSTVRTLERRGLLVRAWGTRGGRKRMILILAS